MRESVTRESGLITYGGHLELRKSEYHKMRGIRGASSDVMFLHTDSRTSMICELHDVDYEGMKGHIYHGRMDGNIVAETRVIPNFRHN